MLLPQGMLPKNHYKKVLPVLLYKRMFFLMENNTSAKKMVSGAF